MMRRPSINMIRGIAACLLWGLWFLLSAVEASGREDYWKEHQIILSGLSDEQITILESTLNRLGDLLPGKTTINPKVYRRLSRFEALFGFPFNGPDLHHWILSRVKSISYQNTWTAAVNQNKGDFFVGDLFFTKTTPLERLYTLIHEARHSDNEGYDHVKCPEGFPFVSSRQADMDLTRVRACDDTDRGAYAFQAAFLFELYAYGIFDRMETGLLYNSSVARVKP